MNIKSVLRVYSQLRTLTDDETALLETLRKFTDSEREAFVEALQPAKPAVRRRASKKASKSARATSLEGAIQKTPKSLDGGVSKMRCVVEGCGEYVDNPVHDSLMGYAGYHEFDSGQALAASGD